MTTVNLGNLSLGELQQVKKQLETEAGMLSQNIAALQSAESRFKLSKEACGQMSKKNEGKELLIPLTQSMYAPGTLADVDELLCDLGTGYFAGKTPPAAVEFFERKVTEAKEKTENQLKEKTQNMEHTVQFMRRAMAQQQQQQQQQQAAAESKA